LGKAGRPEPVLVAHHDERVARVTQRAQSRDHARHELEFLQAVDLLVGRLDDERTVAVDEEHALSTHAAAPADCAIPCTSLSFCSGDPTEMRRLEPSPGCERGSRMIRPTLAAARSTKSGSTQSTSRKFESLGHTRRIDGRGARG